MIYLQTSSCQPASKPVSLPRRKLCSFSQSFIDEDERARIIVSKCVPGSYLSEKKSVNFERNRPKAEVEALIERSIFFLSGVESCGLISNFLANETA